MSANRMVVMLVSLTVPISTAAFADTASEIATAADHAGYAAASLNIDGIHMHLHHAVNCLEGPKGKDFDAAVENPCAKDGNGAIPDATDAATRAKLQAALATAMAGIASDDDGAAKKDATDLYAGLRALK
jgi:hypothetical protein